MNIPFTPTELDALFDRATPVKVGKIREVRRINDMYLKLDHRLNGSFKKEFNCAKKLKDCGIPVTEPLFYLRSGRGNYLVTRAFDGVAVDEYLKHHHESKAFFEKAAKLLCRMLDANFIHRDFHLGNLLYSPSGKNFVLVDVDSVQKIPAFLKRFIPEDVKFDLLTEFRGSLSIIPHTSAIHGRNAGNRYCSDIRSSPLFLTPNFLQPMPMKVNLFPQRK